jgi:hypothetical protein
VKVIRLRSEDVDEREVSTLSSRILSLVAVELHRAKPGLAKMAIHSQLIHHTALVVTMRETHVQDDEDDEYINPQRRASGSTDFCGLQSERTC